MHIISVFVIPSLVIFMMIIDGFELSVRDSRWVAVVVPLLAWSRRHAGDYAAP